MKHLFVFLVFLIYKVASRVPPTETYTNNVTLIEPDIYYLYWNHTDTDIVFEIHVRNKGWAGFGISPNGGMSDSNAIVTFIAPDGSVNFTDRYLVDHRAAKINSDQKWFNLYTAYQNGYLISKFTRKLKVCDPTNHHLNIEPGLNYIVFSFGSNFTSDGDITYHGLNRGSKQLELISTTYKPANLNMKDINTVEYRANVHLLNNVTSEYFCQMFKLPDEWSKKKQHLVRYEVLLGKGNEQNLHHEVIYECSKQFESVFLKNHSIPAPGPCFLKDPKYESNWIEARKYCTKISLAWAVGQSSINDFPKDTAYPYGGSKAEPQYFIMELHYENPTLRQNIVDNSGIRLYVTENYRKHEMGIYAVGAFESDLWKSQIIPPYAPHFNTDYYCHKNCLNTIYGDGDEVKIFAASPHMHLLGSELSATIVRDNKEIAYISNEKTYSFNHQKYDRKFPPIVLKKNDEIKLNCVYDTLKRNTFDYGGFSTPEEMCILFFWYYPRSPKSSGCLETFEKQDWVSFLTNLEKSKEIDVKAVSLYGETLNPNATIDPFSADHINITLLNPKERQLVVNQFQNFYKTHDRNQICVLYNGVELSPSKMTHPEPMTEEKCVEDTSPNVYIVKNSTLNNP